MTWWFICRSNRHLCKVLVALDHIFFTLMYRCVCRVARLLQFSNRKRFDNSILRIHVVQDHQTLFICILIIENLLKWSMQQWYSPFTSWHINSIKTNFNKTRKYDRLAKKNIYIQNKLFAYVLRNVEKVWEVLAKVILFWLMHLRNSHI